MANSRGGGFYFSEEFGFEPQTTKKSPDKKKGDKKDGKEKGKKQKDKRDGKNIS